MPSPVSVVNESCRHPGPPLAPITLLSQPARPVASPDRPFVLLLQRLQPRLPFDPGHTRSSRSILGSPRGGLDGRPLPALRARAAASAGGASHVWPLLSLPAVAPQLRGGVPEAVVAALQQLHMARQVRQQRAQALWPAGRGGGIGGSGAGTKQAVSFHCNGMGRLHQAVATAWAGRCTACQCVSGALPACAVGQHRTPHPRPWRKHFPPRRLRLPARRPAPPPTPQAAAPPGRAARTCASGPTRAAHGARGRPWPGRAQAVRKQRSSEAGVHIVCAFLPRSPSGAH